MSKKIGLHRELEFVAPFLPLSFRECSLLVKWKIPSGIYVDPYQLYTSIQNGTVHFFNHINIEQMAHQAEPITFHSLPKIECSDSYCWSFQLMPIHLRYHLPNTNSSTLVPVPSPKAYYSCDSTSHLDVAGNQSVWQQLAEPKVPEHYTHLPVGDLSHSQTVTTVTIGLAFTATAYVAWIISFH